MYILILALVVAIILVNLVGLSFAATSYLYAQKPANKPASDTTPGKPPKPPKPPAPTGQGGQQPPNKPQPRGKETTIGGKAPTASLVANAEKFFKKYPNRINNPPAAYAGVVAGEYIKVNGGKVTVNRNPTGQPPVKGSGSSGGAPATGSGSGGAPATGSGSGGVPAQASNGKWKKPPKDGVSNLGWSDDGSHTNTKASETHVIINTSGDSAAAAAKKVAELKAQGKYVDGYLNLGRLKPTEHTDMYNEIKEKLAKMGKSINDVTRASDDKWKGERWITPESIADPKIRGVFMTAWKNEIKRMGQQGFDAVNLDNLDYYQKGDKDPSKANLNQATKLWTEVANAGHANGMAMGLKNATEIAPQLANVFDFAVTEQMLQTKDNRQWGIPAFDNFVNQGKLVVNFEVEKRNYGDVPEGWVSYNKGGGSGYQEM